MHIQEGNFAADIEPEYDKQTYVLRHYVYKVFRVSPDSPDGEVVTSGTAKDSQSALKAAERHMRQLSSAKPARKSTRSKVA